MNKDIINIKKQMVENFNRELKERDTKVRLFTRENKDVLEVIDIKSVDEFQTDRMSLYLTDEFYELLENHFRNSYEIKLSYNNTKSCFWAKQSN